MALAPLTALALFATVVTLADIPATVVTLLATPATVVTFALIFSTAAISVDIPATVTMFAVIADKAFTFAIVGPASTAPVDALNPKTVPLRALTKGNSIETDVSLSANLIDLEPSSFNSEAIATNRSSSVFNVAILKAPDDGKSVVLANAMFLVITIVEPPLAPVTVLLDVVFIVPVEPLPPDTV